MWLTAECELSGLSVEEFSKALAAVGERVNFGLPAGQIADAVQKNVFFRSLHLADLALAHACALGLEAAWGRFLALFRRPLVNTAISITGSPTIGQELADSLYAELYGLRLAAGERRCPLASYSGRGSLMSWLRTTVVQRFRDHHRRTHREAPLEAVDCAAPQPAPLPAHLAQLTSALARTLRSLPAEDRFVLSAYYLDRQTLLQIAQTLGVHEATMSRRIKRLARKARELLLENLVAGGISHAAAEEALGIDPRDIEINLRRLLQTSQSSAFSSQGTSVPTTPSGHQ
jgi:RNA polymerase sigma-70 factor (ECF subfamily)